ncbi:hypothetical protein [Streptomyces leeuwenhoekii]|uniref:hypothetical protein n=1 Tax=Streptomyces leeuwenhoekii TaxID=1437453 RepID=UPI0004942F15|nr:hypothetical protein [Streptomyces leeuwenhoekii]
MKEDAGVYQSAGAKVWAAVADTQVGTAQHVGVVRSGEVEVGRRVGEPVGVAVGAVDGGVHDGDDVGHGAARLSRPFAMAGSRVSLT